MEPEFHNNFCNSITWMNSIIFLWAMNESRMYTLKLKLIVTLSCLKLIGFCFNIINALILTKKHAFITNEIVISITYLYIYIICKSPVVALLFWIHSSHISILSTSRSIKDIVKIQQVLNHELEVWSQIFPFTLW